MMNILLINSVCGTGSTGKIVCDLAENFEREGHNVKIAYGRFDYVPEKYKRFAVRIGNKFSVYSHALLSRFTDKHGFFSRHSTKKFIHWADKFNPDVLWLHNIHGYYVNIELLFEWIKSRQNMKIYWTLHDCWSFTGHCAYFSFVNCDKWQTHCNNCPQKKSYPSSFVDNSYWNYETKKNLFTGIKNLTLITPSKWLADLVKKSFLREYPVEVRYNTINTNIFTHKESNFLEKYNLKGKFIILGIASIWEKRKGLDDFIKLSGMLDENFVIVLVGLSTKQIEYLPQNIIGITRTHNQQELAQIYSACDVFFNSTYEDNFPTVNLEAEACGTKVITYDTGGCPETIKNPKSIIVKCGDLESVVKILNEMKNGRQ